MQKKLVHLFSVLYWLSATIVGLQDVRDTSGGCGQSFEVLVVSSEFEGKPLLQRHRLVNNCLAEELKIIHAFSQKTYTPEQWAKMNT